MKSTTLSEIKKELQLLPAPDLVELCISVAKYKKDNKELLGYILFESQNKTQFIVEVKADISEQITELKKQSSLYFVKKGLRKTLRLISKYSKYINDKGLSAELYIHFCTQLKNSGIPFHKSQMLINLYEQQIKKIHSLIDTLHEDLRHDYLALMVNLQ
ncbi:MAG: hypothetical protein SGJ10_07595 [Bacteroidota bacterium]|nr:hypothetical protein [Bacteroidota bacterium]